MAEEQLRALLPRRAEKSISERFSQKLMEKIMTKALSPREYVREQNLGTVSDVSKISAIVQQVIDTHPDAVADYKNGTEKSFHFLFGQVMRETRGQADPGLIRRVLQEKLN